MATPQITVLQWSVGVSAATLSALTALAGGLVAKLGFGILLLRMMLSALTFSVLVLLLLAILLRRLPELLARSASLTSATSEVNEVSEEWQENSSDTQAEYEHVAFNSVSQLATQPESPSSMRQIVEQYTPEQLSKAVQAALHKQ